jgi:glutaredoxin
MRSTHVHVRSVRCPYCTAYFSALDWQKPEVALQQHIESNHKGVTK